MPSEQRGSAAWRAATIFEQFGQPDQAQNAVELAETSAHEGENQELLSRVYHQRANMLETRGDLKGR